MNLTSKDPSEEEEDLGNVGGSNPDKDQKPPPPPE